MYLNQLYMLYKIRENYVEYYYFQTILQIL